MANVAILLLAAGASSRMRGRDKLMEPVDGVPLILRQTQAALATGAPVFVTLPLDRPDRNAALADLPVTLVDVPDAGDGMAASIRSGILALTGDLDGVMVVLADMPDLATDDFNALLDSFEAGPDSPILRGSTEKGQAGHPVLFPDRYFGELAALGGDSGARPVLNAHRGRVRLIPLPDRHALVDLDTPEAWDAWRADQN